MMEKSEMKNPKKLTKKEKASIIAEEEECNTCEHYGIKFPYEKGGCYDCNDTHDNYKK